LQLATEHQQISLPNISVIISEMRAYGYEITGSGNIVYGAPKNQEEGMEIHDDCVSSLMMAVHSMASAAMIPVATSGARKSPPRGNEEQEQPEDTHRQANLGRLLQTLGGMAGVR